jgi:hypothetical protein
MLDRESTCSAAIAPTGSVVGQPAPDASVIAGLDPAIHSKNDGCPDQVRHDDVMCREIMADKSGKQTIQYGIVPIDVIASMSGLDYVRAIFARRLPEPPIMQTVEPFDCTAKPGVQRGV